MGKQGSLIKRFSDILISVISLLVTSPIFLISAIAIKIDSKGPVFFLHERTGLNGKPFRMIKFRGCLLYTSPSPRDRTRSRMPSSA